MCSNVLQNYNIYSILIQASTEQYPYPPTRFLWLDDPTYRQVNASLYCKRFQVSVDTRQTHGQTDRQQQQQ